MDIIRRLAISQARGVNQLSLINELLSWNSVPYRIYTVPNWDRAQTLVYGVTKLPRRSWKNVKARLIAVGFVIEEDSDAMTIRLHFPEAP